MSKRILMVLAKTDFRDEEYTEPRKVFEQAGFAVEVASTQRGACLGKNGLTTYADHDADQVVVEDYDAVVYIGGSGMSRYLKEPAFLKIAQEAYGANKVLAAICVAPMILANAGLLAGRAATVTESESSSFRQMKIKYKNSSVVNCDRIITAAGPAASTEFGEAIRNELLEN